MTGFKVVDKITSLELSLGFRIEVRTQFRKRVEARVRFKDGEGVQDGGRGQRLGQRTKATWSLGRIGIGVGPGSGERPGKI